MYFVQTSASACWQQVRAGSFDFCDLLRWCPHVVENQLHVQCQIDWKETPRILGAGVGLVCPSLMRGAGKPNPSKQLTFLSQCLAEYENEPEPCGTNSSEEFLQ